MSHYEQRRRELIGERRKPRWDIGRRQRHPNPRPRIPKSPPGVLSSRKALYAARRLAQSWGRA